MAIIKDRVKKKKKRQITSYKEDGETLGPLSIPGGNVKWCSHFGKQSKESSSNSERVNHIQEKGKHVSTQKLVHKCSCNLIHNGPKWKEPKCPLTDEWINNTQHAHMIKFYFTIKRNEVLRMDVWHGTAWMKLESTMLNERSQSQRTRLDSI